MNWEAIIQGIVVAVVTALLTWFLSMLSFRGRQRSESDKELVDEFVVLVSSSKDLVLKLESDIELHYGFGSPSSGWDPGQYLDPIDKIRVQVARLQVLTRDGKLLTVLGEFEKALAEPQRALNMYQLTKSNSFQDDIVAEYDKLRKTTDGHVDALLEQMRRVVKRRLRG